MIINIRGTSGSGKSTLVRRVMSAYATVRPEYTADRRQPISYHCVHPAPGGAPLRVLGHYETPCGGCDTIPAQRELEAMARALHTDGANVLYEGLLCSHEQKRTTAMWDDPALDYRVIVLDVPLDVCLASVNARRRAKKPEAEDVNPANTTAKWKTMRRLGDKWNAENRPCWIASRDQAPRLLTEWLGLPGLGYPQERYADGLQGELF
jgi:hypothetical protein